MDTPIVIYGILIKRDVDFGHLLTSITLLAGFMWWLYTTIRRWRTSAREEADSGALRLLLWLLRERQGSPVDLAELKGAFNAPELRSKRIAYCKKNISFRSDDLFERAIYQLDWEGKIDFVGTQAVAFRVDKKPVSTLQEALRPQFVPTREDAESALRVLNEAILEAEAESWKLRATAQAAFALAPEETAAVLRAQLKNGDQRSQRVALELIGALPPL